MMDCVFSTIIAEYITIAFYLTFPYVDLSSFETQFKARITSFKNLDSPYPSRIALFEKHVQEGFGN